MKKINLQGLLFVFALISGCATTGRKYSDSLNRWVGKDINAVIMEWGPPTSTYQMPNGTMTYSWEVHGKAVSVGDADLAVTKFRYCKTTFFVDSSEKVTQSRFEGNYCKPR